jgi:thiamine kinase-like enzyme
MSPDKSQRLAWSAIEASIENIEKVDGGFTAAHRGIVKLPDDRRIFIKLGIDDLTKEWAKKEVETYKILQSHDYPYIPRFLTHNNSETGFAIEALTTNNGWDWSNNWSEPRLVKTLAAMDELASLELTVSDKAFFGVESFTEEDNGWQSFIDSKESQELLINKLREKGHEDLIEKLNFATMHEQSLKFKLDKTTLVHNDVRADNCAWNKQLNTVKLVDWNWAELGDRGIDVNALLVNVQIFGLEVTKDYFSRLDASTLYWLAGYWFMHAVAPIWPGGPDNIRDFQLQSGITAFNMASKLQG